ncbi:hypothetical protein B0H13DRAFT_282997 [Mycena leptocephala]|nr:hypothetical protein B0H13DRAFT_282997 [Mycena leptocephala]
MALQPSEPAPWTVSAVCARWRAIVVSQPRFWVSIHHSDRNRISSFRLETQLRRSAELPLNINFTAFSHRSAEIRDLGFRKLGIICKHAARWEILSMSGTEVLFDQLKACVQDQLARLRELTIEMEYNRYDLGGDVPSLDVFSDAPLLQRVVANKLSWAWPVAMVLPWLQLLRYSGSNIWDGHLLALGNATNLVECSLEIQGQLACRTHQSPYRICFGSPFRIHDFWNASTPLRSWSSVSMRFRQSQLWVSGFHSPPYLHTISIPGPAWPLRWNVFRSCLAILQMFRINSCKRLSHDRRAVD